ncbi:hypothetical protein [Microtetraspora glauca]|uniref:CBM-cenC domain-containing protein n=1 Tax=Microtetraspora glauca TaxID=1996 RepID=A0ABV3GA95_MICGL
MAIPGNLLTADQEDIETSATGWTTGAGTFTRSTVRANTGSASLQIVSAGAGDTFCYSNGNVTGLTAGQTYKGALYVYTSLAGRTAKIGWEWRTSAGTYVADVQSSKALVQNSWTLVEYQAVAPATTTQALLYLPWVTAGAASETYWFDTIFFGPLSTAVTGTLAGALPSLGASVSGTLVAPGVLSGALPPLGASASGQVRVSGSAAAVLPALTASLSGGLAAAGSMAAALPPLAGTLAGAAIASGALTASLPPLAADLAGAIPQDVSGALAATLPALSAGIVGEMLARGTAAPVLPPLGASLAAEATVAGTAAATLPVLSSGLSGALTVSSELAATLPALAANLHGGVLVLRGIRAEAHGPGLAELPIAGPAVRRVLDGPAARHELDGASLVPTPVDGPARVVQALEGPAARRELDGPDVSREVTGVGI